MIILLKSKKMISLIQSFIQKTPEMREAEKEN